jgi:hypothetical protein
MDCSPSTKPPVGVVSESVGRNESEHLVPVLYEAMATLFDRPGRAAGTAEAPRA